MDPAYFGVHIFLYATQCFFFLSKQDVAPSKLPKGNFPDHPAGITKGLFLPQSWYETGQEEVKGAKDVTSPAKVFVLLFFAVHLCQPAAFSSLQYMCRLEGRGVWLCPCGILGVWPSVSIQSWFQEAFDGCNCKKVSRHFHETNYIGSSKSSFGVKTANFFRHNFSESGSLRSQANCRALVCWKHTHLLWEYRASNKNVATWKFLLKGHQVKFCCLCTKATPRLQWNAL